MWIVEELWLFVIFQILGFRFLITMENFNVLSDWEQNLLFLLQFTKMEIFTWQQETENFTAVQQA